MWFHNLVLANALRPAPKPETITIGGAGTAILGSFILLLVLYSVGRLLPSYKKIDDVARVFVAFFGITGVVATIPPFSGVRDWLQSHIASGTANAGGTEGWTLFVTILIAAIGVLVYYHRGTVMNLFWFVLLTMPVFLGSALISISTWYTVSVGQNFWEFVVGFARGR